MLEPFNFPNQLMIHQKLTKKSFYEMGKLSNAQQKLLQEQIDSIQITAHLTADKTNIPVFKSEKHEYIEIFVIETELKNHQAWSDLSGLSAKQLKTLHETFQKAIPYPIILMVHSGNKTQISLAEKHINQADIENEKLILSDLIQTGWISPSETTEIEKQFFNSLSYDQLNKQNLFQLYQSLIQRFTAFLMAEQTGQFELPETTTEAAQIEIDQQRQKLKTIMQLDKQISEFQNKIKDCHQFNEKVELNLQLQKLTDQLSALKVGEAQG